MDLLKQELAKKRKATTTGFGGKSFVRRSELERKQLQQIRDEHLAKAKAKASSTDSTAGAATDANDLDAATQAAEGNSNPNSSSSAAAAAPASAAASVPPALAAKKTTQEEALLSEERRIDELDLPRNEVIRRLRVLREPVTLFGEDDAARLERFKLVLKSGVIDDIDDLDMTEGQTNDFLRDMIEMRKRQKTGRHTYAKSKGKRVGGGDGCEGGADGESADDGGGKGSGDDADGDKDANRMRANFEELCNEDKILVFFKKLLNEWKQELDDTSELEKRTAKGKQMVATFKQCARYLTPLFEFCRMKVPPDDIRQALLYSDWRDWASLTTGPMGLITECALSNDVTDYIRFRAVCTAWRTCAPDPRAISVADRRFHPRRWIMLPDASMSRYRHLLNVHTGERIHVRLPDRRGYNIIGCSFNGLLILWRKPTHVVQLLNLVTGQLTDFPRTTGTMFPYGGGGPADNTTVALVENGWLSVAKPGDKVWTMFKTHDCFLMPFVLPFAGRLYCVTYKNILVVETAANQEPRLAVVSELKLEVGFSWTDDYLYPVYDEEGDLILVHRQSMDDDDCLDDTFAAYRVKLDTGNVEPRHDLGGQALFVCGCRSVSVAPKISSSIRADTIYICRNDTDNVLPEVVAFGLSGTGTQMDKKDVPDYLFDYVCS